MLPVVRIRMVKEIAQHVLGAAIICFWVVVVTGVAGVVLASATNFAGIVW
jgi:hypothetical protein